jgi:hypothetical protein
VSDHPGRKHKRRPRLPGTQPANPRRGGAVFNQLTVLAFIGTDGKAVLCRCRCECGREVIVRHQNLVSGNTKACGCLHRRHGGADTPEHRVWRKMRERCSRPEATGFHNYGGRGIRVCERWQSFENFFADMGARPSPGHTIERIDVDGPYAPDNCRWATNAEQQLNRRNTIRLTYRGETRPLAEWARRFGLSISMVGWRVRHGWPVEAALGTPASGGRAFRVRQDAAT